MELESIHNVERVVYEDFSFPDHNNFVENFLKKEALKYDENNLAKTQVLINNGFTVGYVAMFSDYVYIPKGTVQRRFWSIRSIMGKHAYPAIRIHALAIDKNFQRSGLGTQLLYIALDICKEISESIGVVFVSVESFTDSISFYEKHGFVYINKTNSMLHNLVFKLDELD